MLFIVFAAMQGPYRNYKRAHNSTRLVTLMEGEVWGTLYDLNDRLLDVVGDPP